MEDSLAKKLVDIIAVERKKKGYKSREDFSKAINFPTSTITDIEGGRTKRVPADYILKSCMLLEIDINRALMDEDDYTATKDSYLDRIEKQLISIRKNQEKQNELFFDEIEERKNQIEESEKKGLEENEHKEGA